MGNFLSQFSVLISKDNDLNLPDVQLDFEGNYHYLSFAYCFFLLGFVKISRLPSENSHNHLHFFFTALGSSMSDEDAASYSNVLHMLEPTADLLELLRTYQGCGDHIRQVIN